MSESGLAVRQPWVSLWKWYYILAVIISLINPVKVLHYFDGLLLVLTIVLASRLGVAFKRLAASASYFVAVMIVGYVLGVIEAADLLYSGKIFVFLALIEIIAVQPRGAADVFVGDKLFISAVALHGASIAVNLFISRDGRGYLISEGNYDASILLPVWFLFQRLLAWQASLPVAVGMLATLSRTVTIAAVAYTTWQNSRHGLASLKVRSLAMVTLGAIGVGFIMIVLPSLRGGDNFSEMLANSDRAQYLEALIHVIKSPMVLLFGRVAAVDQYYMSATSLEWMSIAQNGLFDDPTVLRPHNLTAGSMRLIYDFGIVGFIICMRVILSRMGGFALAMFVLVQFGLPHPYLSLFTPLLLVFCWQYKVSSEVEARRAAAGRGVAEVPAT